jgi:putative spermidine/putrescine transport system permease protein
MMRLSEGSWKRWFIPLLLSAPAILLLASLFFAPLIRMANISFHPYSRTEGIGETYSLNNYLSFFEDPYNIRVLIRTLKLSCLTTIVSFLLAFPVARHLVSSKGRARAIITLIVLSPLLVSVIVRTYGWIVILGQNGLIISILKSIGVSEPPRILFTEIAVVVGLTHIFLPYMVLSISSALQNIDPTLRLAALNLGASKVQVFRRITLPLCIPGILAGSLLVFTMSNGAFVSPALLGGPAARVMSALTFQQNLLLFNWPFGAAIAIILLVIVLTAVLLYSRLLERGQKGGQRENA